MSPSPFDSAPVALASALGFSKAPPIDKLDWTIFKVWKAQDTNGAGRPRPVGRDVRRREARALSSGHGSGDIQAEGAKGV